MVRNKYDFIEQILRDKKLTDAQKQRVFVLASKEIARDNQISNDLQQRVKEIEDFIEAFSAYPSTDQSEESTGSIDLPSSSSNLPPQALQRSTLSFEQIISKNTITPQELQQLHEDESIDFGYQSFGDFEFGDFDVLLEAEQASEDRVQEITNKKVGYQTTHDIQHTFDILTSLKFTSSKYAFKFLVHGYSIESLELYNDKLKEISQEFKTLKNVPRSLYLKLRNLIWAYEKYGQSIVQEHSVHPFDYQNQVILDKEDKNSGVDFFKYNNGKSYYKNFSTAIQSFKRDYRFDLEKTESSILSEFIKNVFHYENHISDNQGYTFKFQDSSMLFHQSQLIYDFQEKHFFAWIPSLRAALKWIVASILKHSNIDGNRNFDPKEKQIVISSFEHYNENTDKTYVVLEVLDKGSIILKKADWFIKSLQDVVQDANLKSVCNFEVYFSTSSKEHYHATLLPEVKTNPIPKANEGLVYQFYFIKE